MELDFGQYKIIGAFIEKGNSRPRIILKHNIAPYTTLTGEKRHSHPFYISSGKYSIGKTGNLQPFAGIVANYSSESTFFNGLRDMNMRYLYYYIPQLRTFQKNRTPREVENIGKPMKYTQWLAKCSWSRDFRAELFSTRFPFIDDRVRITSATNILTHLEMYERELPTSGAGPKICNTVFNKITTNFNRDVDIKILKQHEKFIKIKHTYGEEVTTADVPLLSATTINDMIGDDNPFGININNALNAGSSYKDLKEFNSVIESYLRKGSITNTDVLKTIYDILEYLQEMVELPNFGDIIMHISEEYFMKFYFITAEGTIYTRLLNADSNIKDLFIAASSALKDHSYPYWHHVKYTINDVESVGANYRMKVGSTIISRCTIPDDVLLLDHLNNVRYENFGQGNGYAVRIIQRSFAGAGSKRVMMVPLEGDGDC